MSERHVGDSGERSGVSDDESGAATDDDESNPRDEEAAGDVLLVTERQTPEGLLVTVCDGATLGETYAEGEFSLTVTEAFYGEGAEAADEAGVIDSLQRASVANVVGTRAVEVAVEAGIVEEANVLDIGATRHAQLLRM